MSNSDSARQGHTNSRAARHGAASGPRPASVTESSVTYLGLAGFGMGLLVVQRLQPSPVIEILVILAATGLPMLLMDILVLKVHRRPTTGLDWGRAPDFSLRRSSLKVLGLAATLAVLSLAYWIFPEYRDRQYAVVYDLFRTIWPYLAMVSVAYVVIVDAYMTDPLDGYWQAGCLMIGRLSAVDREVFGQYCRGWLVKGFFIPFMISVFVDSIHAIFDSGLLKGAGGFQSFYEFGYALAYGVDMAFAALGYFLTCRVIDAHIRSTEPTIIGWVVALACYPPFWPQISTSFLSYDAHAVYWGRWLGSEPLLYWIWGTMILCCLAVYAWSTVMFGCRFSNLTHRGILTNGPYRWSKHPAYLSKNLSWWLVAVPFVSSSGVADAVRSCVMLGLLNTIYFLRARTEELHLSRDPTYIAYALWINDNGALRRLGQLLPALRYQAPTTARLEVGK